MSDTQTPMPDFVPQRASTSHRAASRNVTREVRRRLAGISSALASPARLRVAAVLAGALAMLGIVVGAHAVTAATTPRPQGADGLVEAYLDALAIGDVDAALALAPPDATQGSTALLTEEAYLQATSRGVRCAPAEVFDDEARVSCSMVAGGGLGMTMRLERIDGAWTIVQGLEQLVTNDGNVPLATVGGAQVPQSVAEGTEAVWLLPGQYPLATDIEVRDDIVLLGWMWMDGGGGYMALGGQPTAQLEATAEALAEQHVVECSMHTTDGCGTVEPPTDGTSWVAMTGGFAYQVDVAPDDTDLQLSVLVQRFDDGVPGAVHQVVLTAPIDGDEGELMIEGVTAALTP